MPNCEAAGTQSTISIDDFVMMDAERNEVFARNHTIHVLPGQTSVVDDDKLLTVNWKTEGTYALLLAPASAQRSLIAVVVPAAACICHLRRSVESRDQGL